MRGYTHATQGQIEQAKLASLVRKFALFYGIGLRSTERTRNKKRGIGAARMLVYQPDPKGIAWWVLLVTFPAAGAHPAHAAEKLRDVRDSESRLRFYDYELLQLTRPESDKKVWTWRMQKEPYKGWRERLTRLVRARADLELAQAIRTISSMPGFSGVRTQIKALYKLIRDEWRRSRADSETLPEIPKGVGYLRKKANPSRSITLGRDPPPRKRVKKPKPKTTEPPPVAEGGEPS